MRSAQMLEDVGIATNIGGALNLLGCLLVFFTITFHGLAGRSRAMRVILHITVANIG